MARSRLRRLAGLDVAQWRALLLTQWLLPQLRRRLRRHGLKNTVRWVAGRTPSRRQGAPSPAEIRRMAAAVNASSHHGLFRGTCLERSLVLNYLLHRRGVPHELVIGADLHERHFNAHAWVECAGEVVNDAPDVRERFGVFEVRDTGYGARDTRRD